jgi:hypothetical protein
MVLSQVHSSIVDRSLEIRLIHPERSKISKLWIVAGERLLFRFEAQLWLQAGKMLGNEEGICHWEQAIKQLQEPTRYVRRNRRGKVDFRSRYKTRCIAANYVRAIRTGYRLVPEVACIPNAIQLAKPSWWDKISLRISYYLFISAMHRSVKLPYMLRVAKAEA